MKECLEDLHMISHIFSFIGKVASSKLGQVLTLVHLLLIVYALASRGEATFHFHYETTLLKALFILDLPALTFLSIVALPFKSLIDYITPFRWAYWIGGATALFCVSVQWWFVGYLIERFIRGSRIK